MRYCVYDAGDWDSHTKIHEENCGDHRQHGKRYWHCFFETKEEACHKAADIGRLQIRCCKKCNP